MNAPKITELFELPDGAVSQVEMKDDSKAKNAAIFTLYLEDHTAGNLLRYSLLRDESIRFAGYRKPHPLENKIEIKVHTNGKKTPQDAMENASNRLYHEFAKMKNDFDYKIAQLKK